MDNEENGWKAHVLVLPFPGQGHLNPMLQFSKRLASKGLKVTLATTIFVTKSMQAVPGPVQIQPFSDGCDEGGILEAGGIDAYVERLEVVGSRNISRLIEQHSTSKHPVKCLVYGSYLTWGLDLAKQHGLVGASFFTQSCAVSAVYYNVQCGALRIPVEDPTISLPGLPLLTTHDLPSLVNGSSTYPVTAQFVLKQFSDVKEIDWLLFNTFDKLEDEVVNWLATQWPMKMITIGPTLPSIYLDNRLEGDNDYGIYLLKPDSSTCMKWLNTKQSKSVVYVSFGSIASVGEGQMEEIARGLMKSETSFLWVVRASEEQKLPKEFKEETSEKWLVVTWCSQLEVLAHPAVGCFITHCGWNSTLEAVSLGVPMVALPQWTDQTTNAKFVKDVWNMGVRAEIGEEGIVKREEIERCIRDVMQGEKSEEFNRNATKWKELAKVAMGRGGSSDKNIDIFVNSIITH